MGSPSFTSDYPAHEFGHVLVEAWKEPRVTVTELNHQTTKLNKALQDLPAAYAQLHLFQLPGSRPSDTGSKQRHGALSTRTPLVLEVLDLLDERTKDAEPTRENYELDRLVGQRRLGVLPTLSQWVRLADSDMWDRGHDHDPPQDQATVQTECAWLSSNLEWISQQNWSQDITDDIHHMLTDCQRIIGIEAQARYYCTRCAWPIVEITDRVNQGGYRCTGCPNVWTRIELHKMAERKTPKTLAQIATLTKISLKTLRKYAELGHLKVVAREGNANLYDLDAVALATMNLKYKRSGLRVA